MSIRRFVYAPAMGLAFALLAAFGVVSVGGAGTLLALRKMKLASLEAYPVRLFLGMRANESQFSGAEIAACITGMCAEWANHHGSDPVDLVRRGARNGRFVSDGRVMTRGTDSPNGTLLDGQRIREAPLRSGSRITIGAPTTDETGTPALGYAAVRAILRAEKNPLWSVPNTLEQWPAEWFDLIQAVKKRHRTT